MEIKPALITKSSVRIVINSLRLARGFFLLFEEENNNFYVQFRTFYNQ